MKHYNINSVSNSKKSSKEVWVQQLLDVVTDPLELLNILNIKNNNKIISAPKQFPMRVPRTFIERMHYGDIHDPLLLQVLTTAKENINIQGYSFDPLNEQSIARLPGLLHKYKNRVLLLIKGRCAINCRYCFRRHFPYHIHKMNKKNWNNILQYIDSHPEINEVILSGGDPMMAKDAELNNIITQLENISHIKKLRIHTRLPVVIPARITIQLCQRFKKSRLQIILVTHINHPQEIDKNLSNSMLLLKKNGVTLLNQSVLLRNINNNAKILADLSNALFDIGILPYYLNMLDKVQGASAFFVSDEEACAIMRNLLKKLSGYLVPRLIRDSSDILNKIPLNLY
ncbi:MAG: EF-P beta-lysylation protein EpmB [Candidatus Dasytiphilus stammeri]